MRVVFAGGGTGGHLYPGLAIARTLRRIAPEVEPYFVGARRGIEREVLPQTEFAHELLDLHPLYRARPWENWRTLRGGIGAWRTLGRRMREERPSLVVGTGGYAAGVALGWAVAHRVPLALQEQNSFPGLTMRAFGRFAREVWLGYPEARAWFGRTTTVDTGNPIEPPGEPRPERASSREKWGFPREGGRVVLVVGGSQGALAVNEAIAGWVRRGLPDDVRLIWATGRAQYERFASLERERVRVRPYLSPIAEAYAAADLVVARAGAMTTAELCAWALPMILIPLPTAAADHQTANARALEEADAAIHLPQREASADRLDSIVRDLLGAPDRLRALAAAAARRGRPNAAEDIARRILTLIQLKQLRS